MVSRIPSSSSIDDCYNHRNKPVLTELEKRKIDEDIDAFVAKVTPTQATMDTLWQVYNQVKEAIAPLLTDNDLIVYGSAANGLFEHPTQAAAVQQSDLDLSIVSHGKLSQTMNEQKKLLTSVAQLLEKAHKSRKITLLDGSGERGKKIIPIETKFGALLECKIQVSVF